METLLFEDLSNLLSSLTQSVQNEWHDWYQDFALSTDDLVWNTEQDRLYSEYLTKLHNHQITKETFNRFVSDMKQIDVMQNNIHHLERIPGDLDNNPDTTNKQTLERMVRTTLRQW